MAVKTSNIYGKITISDTSVAKIAHYSAIDCYGNIHCGDNAGYYHVIRPDGTVLFKEQIGTNIWSSPVIADNGIIYINLKDGSACKLLAIDMGLDGPSDSCWPQRACNAAHTALQK